VNVVPQNQPIEMAGRRMRVARDGSQTKAGSAAGSRPTGLDCAFHFFVELRPTHALSLFHEFG
jgi:hypothetical protein